MHRAWLMAGALGVAGALYLPSYAQACGGTFCDGGAQSMPVDQTGENILFVFDGDRIEAHIQIQYDPTTEAEKFAWVLPLTAVPDFSVGSQQLFENILAATVPTYGFTNFTEPCAPPDDDGWDHCWDGGGGGDDDGGGVKFDAAGGGDDGPDVVKRETVGAFEIVVLEGGTAAEVMQWLGDNGYDQDPDAEPILAEYLAEGHVFAAFKLVPGADTSEIHPIVVSYEGTEPCVPIRLTRIAAAENMDIRTFFLGVGRAAPTNYRHVELNPLKADWLGLGQNYKDLVTMAVDAPGAEGHAFVTEYAGTSDVVSRIGIWDASWDAEPFTAAAPVDVVNLLMNQDFLQCFGGECEYQHALILGLLRQWLPAPANIPEEEFYSCLSCYEGLIDVDAWDGPAFAGALSERIIDPGLHANGLLDTWPELTRLYTTLSPHEMTLDPMFHEDPSLPPAQLPGGVGTRNLWCDGGSDFDLPDGRNVELENVSAWPDIFPDDMPWAARVEQMIPGMPTQVLVDDTMLIDELLAQWNAEHVDRLPPRSHCGETGDDDGWEPGDSSGGGGAADGTSSARGCACGIPADAGPAGIALLAPLLLVRRRRPAARPRG